MYMARSILYYHITGIILSYMTGRVVLMVSQGMILFSMKMYIANYFDSLMTEVLII